MLSNKMRRLCPYLKKTASRQDAASSSYSLPDAVKTCPYVKELFTGFGSKTQDAQSDKEASQGESRYKFNEHIDEKNEPTLFKMENDKKNEDLKVYLGSTSNMFGTLKSTDIVSGVDIDGGQPKSHETQLNMYDQKFNNCIDTLKKEGRYRTFINIQRHLGSFPNATRREGQVKKSEVVVWCSNDYLGMGQHPKVLQAMHKAIDTSGAGSGGTRNIGGNTCYIENLEQEIAELHNKDKALVCSSWYVANEAALATLPSILGEDTIYFSDSK